MRIEIRRMEILQTGKLMAMLCAFVALLTLPFVLMRLAVEPPGTEPEGRMLALFVVIALYPLIGFIGGMILAAFYNVSARITGGLHLEIFEIIAAPQHVGPPDAGQEPAV